MTPEELLQKCLDHDEYGWTCAYNHVMRYLSYLQVAGPEKEDIAQDTIKYFLEGRLQRINNPRMFMQLLRMKAKGIFLQRVLSERKHPAEPLTLCGMDETVEMKENPDIPPVHPDMETRLWLQKAAGIINTAIAKTGNKCGKLLQFYYEYRYTGKKIKTLACDLGEDYDKLRLDIFRCCKKLFQQPEYRKLLEEHQSMPSLNG